MFDILRKRIVKAMDIKEYSFEDLDKLEIGTVDNICLADLTDNSDTESISSISTCSTTAGFDRIEHRAKYKVSKMLVSIRKLEKIHELRKDSSKLGLLTFIDVIRDQQYRDVQMTFLDDFVKTCRLSPKSYYLHYYIYFLYYAAYYHHNRAKVDVIDNKMKFHHKTQLVSIKYQIKYLQYVIRQSVAKKQRNDLKSK